MNIICLDLEGVLVPEIWIAFSEETGIKELSLTTRDISDYDVLMKKRIGILKENNLKLKDIQNVIGTMSPLDGALEFLNTIREKTQVIILSDTFTEFAKPLMKKLKWPTLFCNNLVISEDGSVSDYKLRQKNGKYEAVKAFKSIGYGVIAAGDSYNDVTMLKCADHGIFFRPPAGITKEFPEIPVTETYEQLLSEINKVL
jgi:phosphoserine / homoserine phosphotransferase